MQKNFFGKLGDCIWLLTRQKSRLGFGLNKIARIYSAAYEDRGDNPQWNGEHNLLDIAARMQSRTIFDVGANVGNWTDSALSRIPGATIHAFELTPVTAATLNERFKSHPRVVVRSFGLSNFKGEVEFRQFEGDSQLNTLLVENNIHLLPSEITLAEVACGEDYCQQHEINNIDFLKIDAEGTDHLVLEGFRSLISKRAIRLIQFEYGYAALPSRFFIEDFIKFFHEFRYRVAPLRSKGIDTGPYHITWNAFDSGPNYVAFREDDEDLIKMLST